MAKSEYFRILLKNKNLKVQMNIPYDHTHNIFNNLLANQIPMW